MGPFSDRYQSEGWSVRRGGGGGTERGGICGFDPHQRTRISDPAPPTLFLSSSGRHQNPFSFPDPGIASRLPTPFFLFVESPHVFGRGRERKEEGLNAGVIVFMWGGEGGRPPFAALSGKENAAGERIYRVPKTLACICAPQSYSQAPCKVSPTLPPKMPACREDKALGGGGGDGKERVGWGIGRLCDATQIPAHAPQQRTTQKAGKQGSNSTWTYCSVRKSIIGLKTRGCTQFKNKT